MRVQSIARTGLVAGALAALLGAAPAGAQAVKIGVILSLSGPDSAPGVQLLKGIDLYMKEHGKDLPPGVTAELVTRDDTGPNPDVAKRLAQELITRDHVNFITGVVYSPNAMAIAPLTAEAKLPFVIMSAANSAITRLSPYVTRVSKTLWEVGEPMGQWSARQNWKKAYTAVSDFSAGYDAEAAFSRGFTEGGGQMVGSARMPLGNPDFIPVLQRIKDAKPEVAFVFVPGGKQSTAIMKGWGDLGLDAAGIKMVTTEDVVTDEELPNMGDIPLGVVSSGVYSNAAVRPRNKEFLAAWDKEYHGTAIANYNSVFAWDGMTAIFDVIRQTKGKFSGDEAMAILKGWKDPNSPRGPITIDAETRDIVQNVYIRRVEKQDGKLANIEIETFPQVKDRWKELNPPK